ncbi:cation-transporting P-type ATPase [Streptomyces iconiensis]|uniref:Cation-transporting P-type ATPase n=1 Tax=Streptomyces iconiensis TaxID=1384038 RepID=A0ABT6ZZ21_9ACTN|nr:cation-transporting P-type ATPase [Streptomyces iconiensis]MDJ1134328.1 cation-transporting P-type ATPase [Streptomyces iconiensis]
MTSLEALRHLNTGPRGLLNADADDRLARYGENTFPGRRTPSWPARLAHAMRDPFTAVLLCLGLVSAVIASWGTACVIAVLVVVSGALRASGEYRADRSLATLGALLPTTATVRRRATEDAPPETREVPVDQLVPGDVVRLGPGDLVPADLRLLRATGLTVHQAALTGESAPVTKHPVEAPTTAPPGAQGTPEDGDTAYAAPQLCFQGSSVASGSATGVVVATGAATHFADAHRGGHRGAHRGAPTRQRASAFDRSVNGVAWILIRFMLLTPPLVLMANAALRGRGLETLPFAVAVAVGLTPEMLPVVVTTALARGASVLARSREVIVRRLPALHDLGAADVLCTDKTGTLTQGRPVLDCSLGPDGAPDPTVAQWAALNSFWTLHLAELPVPDALDEALLDQLPPDDEDTTAEPAEPGIGEWEGVAALPFDPVRRISCAVVRAPYTPSGADTGTADTVAADTGTSTGTSTGRDRGTGRGADRGTDTVVVKGAAEDVLERCALEEGTRATLRQRAAALAEDGLRVLAVATAERRARLGPYVPGDERGLTFRGFVGLRDALVPTAAEALADLARQGVTVKVLTGDHPGTAARACRDLGLLAEPWSGTGTGPGTEHTRRGDDEVVTGDRIDALDDTELAEVACRYTVFARCTPAHKARVVGALRAHGHKHGRGHTHSRGHKRGQGHEHTQGHGHKRGYTHEHGHTHTQGHITGFLGDGVNDLAALHTADIGLAPRDAAPVAREAADVVLAAKDLTAIGEAIATGRRSGGNIASYLRIVLSSNLGNVLAMLVAGLMLPFLPMFPAQVLVQNLCFDAAQLAFAFDRPCRSTLRGPTVLRPRALLGFITGFGLLNAVADLATFAVLGLALHGMPGENSQDVFHAGWFTENLLTQGMVMVLLRTGRGAAFARTPGPLRLAVAGLTAVGLLLPLSPLGPPLGMTALPLVYYPMLGLVLALYGGALVAARARYERRAASTPRTVGDDGPGTTGNTSANANAHAKSKPKTKTKPNAKTKAKTKGKAKANAGVERGEAEDG